MSSTVLKRWREARLGPEQRAAVAEALAVTGGNKSQAAKLLGLSRMHLYRLIGAGVIGDARDTVTRGDTATSRDAVTLVTAVTPTSKDSLTYGRTAHTLRPVSSAAIAIPDAQEETVRVALDLPRSLVNWIELEGLKRKQDGRTPRQAKSPIVVEALERYRSELRTTPAQTKEPGRRKGRGTDGGGR